MKKQEVIKFLNEKGFHPGDVAVSTKNKTYTAYWSYFYTNGKSADKYAESLKSVFPDIEIVNRRQVYKPFRGGDTTRQGSHFSVEFRFADSK